MLYGRFATSFVGGGSSDGRVERERVLPVERRAAGCRARSRLERAVELDRVDVRDALGEVAREDAEARADLEHDVVGLEVGEAPDHAEDVLVDEEVLAELLLRRRPSQPERGGGVGVDPRARARPRPRRAPRRARRACA